MLRTPLLLLVTMVALAATDVVTVDSTSTLIITGLTPATAATGEVRLGNGQVNANGTVTAGDVVITRATQAASTEAVRGDDPRLSDARPANGGNAATLGGVALGGLLQTSLLGAANGIATLNASGQVPAAQLPAISSSHGMTVFTASGTFNVPSGVTMLQVLALGGGGGGGAYVVSSKLDGGTGAAGGLIWTSLVVGASSYPVVVGAGGVGGISFQNGGTGGTTSFGGAIIQSTGGGGGPYGSPTGVGAGGTASFTGSGGPGLLLTGRPGAAPLLGPYMGSGGIGGNGVNYGAAGSPGVVIVWW